MTRARPMIRRVDPRPSTGAAIAAAAAALAVVLAACGPGAATSAPVASPGASRSAAGAAVQKAEGLVTDIVASGPVGVASFTIRTNDGEAMVFTVGTLDVTAGGFPAEHLSEHRLASEPVSVSYRDEGGRHVAIRLTDVAASPSPS